MANTNKIIAISAPVSVIEAQADGDKKNPAKFDSTFYTGGAMNIAGYEHPVVIDLSGLGRGNVLVANLDHDETKRVGNFDVENDGKSLVAKGTATAATAARDEVINSAKDGYQWQASLEVVPHQIEMLGKNKTAVVNGQEVTGPAYITRKGTLKGFGFVSHGADDNTTVAIAASAASKKEKNTMKAEVRAWIEARFPSVDIDAMTPEEVANWEADYEGRQGTRQAQKAKSNSDSVGAAMLEAKRIEEYESIIANYLSDIPREFKTIAFVEKVGDMKAQAIEESWTPEKLDLELLRGSKNIARPILGGKRGVNKITDEVLEAAICMTGGLRNLDNHFDDQTLQTAHDNFRNGIGLKQVFDIAAKANGYNQGDYEITLEKQRAAFGMRPQYASTGFSTYDLSGILGSSAYKFMLDGWGGGEMTWQSVSDITSVRDFKQITQYRLGGTLKYEKVGPGGEIKHGTVTESSYTLQADTYGKMFAVTRTDYVNDDLNALTAVPRELGYGANEAFNEVFWTAWLGATYSYTSSGTITAATVLASVAAAEAAFFALTKPNGEPVSITPTVMLMPNGSYRVAKDAIMSPTVTGGSSAVPTANSFNGEYNVVRSAYLSNSAYTGYSAIKWYLCAVRPGFAPIQTAFLNGNQSPTIESTTAAFDTLGVQMRGVHDFGVSIMEARAVVQGSGA